MILDLRRQYAGTKLHAELCVIGAGAAGIAIALELLDSGLDVIVLESGGARIRPETERFNEGEVHGIDHQSLVSGRARVLGGATALWAGQCLPGQPETFGERGWVPHSGWPFGLAELEPYYRRAEQVLRIEDEIYDERVWDRFGVERPRVDAGRFVHRFSVWCPRPHLGRLYRRPLARSRTVRILLNATVTELVTTSPGDRFESVRAATPDGLSVRIHAPACILCAGGIENARLLLASTATHASGIGNRHDAVGRYFQDHPSGHCGVIVDSDVARLQQLYGLFYSGRVRYLPRIVLTAEAQQAEEVLSCAAYPAFHFGEDSGIEAGRRIYRSVRSGRRPGALNRDLWRVGRDLPTIASTLHRRVRHGRSPRLSPSTVTLHTDAEQAPNRESRVALGRRRDSLGVPLPVVEWKLTELDRRTTEVMIRAVGEEFRRLGIGGVRAAPWLAEPDWQLRMLDSFHHIGTTRLGEDPETSVVNSQCQIHDVSGMFVAGSSVFPVAGYVNPTLTIMALAIRLADHIKRAADGRL